MSNLNGDMNRFHESAIFVSYRIDLVVDLDSRSRRYPKQKFLKT